jgi:methylmalonyl-CoA mutase
MDFPAVTLADWRAQVDKELAGRSFEKVLVQETAEGIPIAPLYTTAPESDLVRDPDARRFRLCTRLPAGASAGDVAEEIAGGADAIWGGFDVITREVGVEALARTFFVFDSGGESALEATARVAARLGDGARLGFALNEDPVGRRAQAFAPFTTLSADLASLGRLAGAIDRESAWTGSTAVMVSTLPYHDAGADSAEEIALALATGAEYLGALVESGLAADRAARQVAVQIAVGRDTFLELCKVRALRTCWQKLIAAFGVSGSPRTLVHAVSSSRTLTVRDPWVNLLRVTTQVFSAVLGGADLVTPAAFDQALGPPSALGRRVARNTGLVLREESFLGRVADPAGGSYYLETLTDALAREAWKRFQALERDGGIVAALESGRLAAKLEAAWHARVAQIAKRKIPILGVSEFANLDEVLPRPAARSSAGSGAGGLPVHRDAEPFEALRARAEDAASPPEALLVALGPLGESRPRVGFATGFFSAGGIRTRESATDEKARIACLCGSDERYATEAVSRVRALKAAGCARVLVAGRPGALEPALREAGADGFIFVGCDVVATLSELLGGQS